MNEEWWGITAKGAPDANGLYDIYPRAAYYALREAYRLDPYAEGTDLTTIRAHFASIQPMAAVLTARGDAASLRTDAFSKVRVAGLRMEFETYSTGGSNISTPPAETPQTGYPSYLGFDHGQSFYADFEAKPSDAVVGRLSLNVLGHVPTNPIDEVFYENRGRQQRVQGPDDEIVYPRLARAREGLPVLGHLGRPHVHPGRLLPHGASALAVRGRLLRPVPRRLLRREPGHLQRRGDRAPSSPASAR